MLYDQLTYHKIYYHKFQLTGGIVWQLGALLRNLVVIWMSFTTCDTSLLNRSRPVLLMKYRHKKTTKSHSQYNLYPLKLNWTWLVFSIIICGRLMTKFQIEKCDLDVWFKFIPVLFYYFHADMFMLHTWWCMIKQRKIKKKLKLNCKTSQPSHFSLLIFLNCEEIL